MENVTLQTDITSNIETIYNFILDDDIESNKGLYYSIRYYLNANCTDKYISEMKSIINNEKEELVNFLKSTFNITSIAGCLNVHDFAKKDKIEFPKDTDWSIYENRYRAAKCCKNASEYREVYRAAYDETRKHINELSSFEWLNIKRSYNEYDRIHYVYYYEDKLNHACYVGRTNDIILRHNSHSTQEKDSVYKYFKQHNQTVPNMIILKDKLNLEESRFYEGEYVKIFKNNGYNIINIAKTGIKSSSIGGLNTWHYSSCLKYALSSISVADFHSNTQSGYYASINNKWMYDFIWFQRIGKEYKSYKNERATWPNERMWFFISLFGNLNNLKKCNKDCYDYINENNLISNFYTDNLIARDMPICYKNELESLIILFKKMIIEVSSKEENVIDYIQIVDGFKCHQQYFYCVSKALECKKRSEFDDLYSKPYQDSIKYSWINDYFWLKKPQCKGRQFRTIEQNIANETFPIDRIWFNVLLYETKDILKNRCPSIYNHIKNEEDKYYTIDGYAQNPPIRVLLRLKDSLDKAKDFLNTEHIWKKEEYLSGQNYIKYVYESLNVEYLSCLGSNIFQRDWANDFIWIKKQHNSFNKSSNKPQTKKYFPDERLWFLVLFHKNKSNLKKYCHSCYMYIENNNIIDTYYNNEIPKYPNDNILTTLILDAIDKIKRLQSK